MGWWSELDRGDRHRSLVEWDGRDGNGQPVVNGLYLYRLQAGDQAAAPKMLFAK